MNPELVHDPLVLLENIEESKINYKNDLEDIINTPITSKNIDTYAEKVLTKLVDLIDEVIISEYKDINIKKDKITREMEEVTFQNNGLSDIGFILDYFYGMASQINQIDNFITWMEQGDQVILPTSTSNTVIERNGSGNWEKRESVPKLKTLLYVLGEDFGIDIHDSNQLQIKRSATNPRMVRNEGYYAVLVPSLNRMIFVCDEIGNATYIIDTLVMEKIDGVDDISKLTKLELAELIKKHRDLGTRIMYKADTFMSRLKDYIDEPVRPEKNPNNLVSAEAGATILGVNPNTFQNAVDRLKEGGKLGEDIFYLFGKRWVVGYDTYKLTIIKENLSSDLYAPKAPEGVLSIKRFAISAGHDPRTVIDILVDLGINPDSLPEYRFGSRTACGVDKRLQERIIEEINNRNR